MEEFEVKNHSTESPSSVTYSLVRNGFNLLYTVRGDSGVTLLEAMEAIEKKLMEKGYKPQEKRSFGGGAKPIEYVPDRVCPLCQNKLIYQTLKDGRKMIKCSTSKYDFATKTSSGCKFVEWPDANKQVVADVVRDY
jgi:hypothetical protein